MRPKTANNRTCTNLVNKILSTTNKWRWCLALLNTTWVKGVEASTTCPSLELSPLVTWECKPRVKGSNSMWVAMTIPRKDPESLRLQPQEVSHCEVLKGREDGSMHPTVLRGRSSSCFLYSWSWELQGPQLVRALQVERGFGLISLSLFNLIVLEWIFFDPYYLSWEERQRRETLHYQNIYFWYWGWGWIILSYRFKLI